MTDRADSRQQPDTSDDFAKVADNVDARFASERVSPFESEHLASAEIGDPSGEVFHDDAESLRMHAPMSSTEAHIRRAYAAQAMKQKDHISAGLLAIFLGMFGVHKFYLGYNQAAFAMLSVTVIGSIVTFGLAGAVMWVIAIIEGIVYLTKSQTDFDKTYVLEQREWF